MFNNHITRIGSASASDRNIPANGSFNIWWRNITKKELSADLYRNREISFARVFSVLDLLVISVGTPLITKAFLLTAVSKKAAHFSAFVKYYFENGYKKLDSTSL